jgi:hypothetical protein
MNGYPINTSQGKVLWGERKGSRRNLGSASFSRSTHPTCITRLRRDHKFFAEDPSCERATAKAPLTALRLRQRLHLLVLVSISIQRTFPFKPKTPTSHLSIIIKEWVVPPPKGPSLVHVNKRPHSRTLPNQSEKILGDANPTSTPDQSLTPSSKP